MVFRYLLLFLLYVNIKIDVFIVRLAGGRWPPVWETAVHLAVAGGVFDCVFCAVLFPTRCLG